MRILTYNIHGWRDAFDQMDVARLARIIAASEADVVALNEVFHPLASPDAGRPALELLAEMLGMQAAFGVALTPQFAFAPLASYGNALLTRYPLLAHAGHHLPAMEGHEQRGLLEARLLLPDGRHSLSIYVTHLDHRSEALRVQQLAAAFQWTVRDRARPHVLLGDFNSLTASDLVDNPAAVRVLQQDPELQRLASEELQVTDRLQRRGYVDAQAAQPTATFPADAPAVRIDYIWLSAPLAPALRWCRPWITDETAVASDHLPLLAELDLSLAEF